MAELSSDVRANILLLNQDGHSQRSIANRVGVSKTAVQKTIKRFHENGSLNSKIRCGRPKKTSARTDNLIRRLAVASPTATSGNILSQLPPETNISPSTVRRRLFNQFKLKSFRPAKKPLLSRKNIRDRLNFCRTYRHWGEAEWSSVLFSDETIIRQAGATSLRVRRPPNARYNNRYTVPTVKHSPQTMIWGSISAKGPAGIYVLPPGQTINAAKYVDIMESEVLHSLSEHSCNVYQHDGAPCHQAGVCKTWLRNKQITVLEPWPGSSPDLNPIEHCWSVMKRKVAQHKPSSLSQLRQIIHRVWTEEISEELCRDLVLSMPKRIEAVIKAKGKTTKY